MRHEHAAKVSPNLFYPSPMTDRQRGYASASEHIGNIESLTAECEAALERDGPGAMVRYELPALHWLALFDEITGRRRENYSKLVADRSVAELNAVIDRLHDLVVYILANGPGQITDAMAFDAKAVLGDSNNRLARGLQNLSAMRRKQT